MRWVDGWMEEEEVERKLAIANVIFWPLAAKSGCVTQFSGEPRTTSRCSELLESLCGVHRCSARSVALKLPAGLDQPREHHPVLLSSASTI